MTAVRRLEPLGIADVAGLGTVVAAGPGEGPDGAIIIVWDDDRRTFWIWETWDGAVWVLTGDAVGQQPLDLGNAAIVASRLLAWLREHQEYVDRTIELPDVLIVGPWRKPDVQC